MVNLPLDTLQFPGISDQGRRSQDMSYAKVGDYSNVWGLLQVIPIPTSIAIPPPVRHSWVVAENCIECFGRRRVVAKVPLRYVSPMEERA